MPIYPPRIEPIKKENQLSQKEMELQSAIKNEVSGEKLIKITEKYRAAYLSLLKAKIHSIQEKEFQKKHIISKLRTLKTRKRNG